MYFILFINTYLINKNSLQFNFKFTLPYYIYQVFCNSNIETLAIKKLLFNCHSIIFLAKFICNCSYQICNYHTLFNIIPNLGPVILLAIIEFYSYRVCIYKGPTVGHRFKPKSGLTICCLVTTGTESHSSRPT